MTTLNTLALTNVVRSLEAGLTKLKLAQPGSVHYELYRNSVVKSYELAVEIAGKLLRKALKAILGDPRAVDAMVFNEVLRHAGKHGILTLLNWKDGSLVVNNATQRLMIAVKSLPKKC